MKKPKSKILVVVSDLHCGSEVGLMPPESPTHSGNTIGFGKNYCQRWLWQNWFIGCEKALNITGGDPFVLLVNGDATEGIHHRSPEVVASRIEDHTNMAVAALKTLSSEASEKLVTLGTECHTLNMENLLALKIGAKGDKAQAKWLFEINGVLCDAAHHIGVTSRGYLEAGQMSIALQNARLNSLRSGQRPARVFLRGHRHCGGHYSDGNAMLGITGGWQFLTRHGQKVVTDSIPRPSIMILDWRNREQGELPEVREMVFEPPQDPIAKL